MKMGLAVKNLVALTFVNTSNSFFYIKKVKQKCFPMNSAARISVKKFQAKYGPTLNKKYKGNHERNISEKNSKMLNAE